VGIGRVFGTTGTTASGKVRSWWITCVGLWVGRSVELDHERAGSWKHWNP